ncbi:MAG: translation initiation factor IF-2 N-terminal domain-containing protein, partial [Patescibacteria group bacterium]
MAGRRKQRKLSKKESKALKKVGDRPQFVESTREQVRAAVAVTLPQTVTVSDLSKLSGRTPSEIIGALMKNGVLASMNDSLDRETVEILAEELAMTISHSSDILETVQDTEGEQVTRPPVVTILGHVDHGKTTLLDSIRETQVAAKESGGITQHIGAYKVNWSDKAGSQRAITFLDTPGHEAFSALRAHGATMTDIAILVVAADDGVKPQTKEALSHAKAANVPIIGALNKVDKPEANIDRVKAELVELGLQPEEWGGKTPVVAVSAKAKTGIDDLLDTVLLVADLLELTARHEGPAT